MSSEEKHIDDKEKDAEKPLIPYVKREIRIFHSHEEQAEYNTQQMALLSPEESMLNLRKLINLAYGMHGYDPDNLPVKHSIKIIRKG